MIELNWIELNWIELNWIIHPFYRELISVYWLKCPCWIGVVVVWKANFVKKRELILSFNPVLFLHYSVPAAPNSLHYIRRLQLLFILHFWEIYLKTDILSLLAVPAVMRNKISTFNSPGLSTKPPSSSWIRNLSCWNQHL